MVSEEYKNGLNKLNKEQKQAVTSLDGPVMVVAGPGTGKTQVLALRIAHILEVTDTKPDGILCLTFTNSGVRAMRERLERYIGSSAQHVVVSTFHSFALNLIEKNYELLDFAQTPTLLNDDEAVFLIDEILHSYDWQHIRPRSDPTMYFKDLKSLIGILKREDISADDFLIAVDLDIDKLQNDPLNLSSRGETKGQLKKEIQTRIESLNRTKEVVQFYTYYENKKRENCLMDYDDALNYAVKLAQNFEDVRADIRENYLYVLVDEHQDSSGVQNNFLKAVWQDSEVTPNIFVVGDDRQLIYGFSGANISYFEEFKTIFGKAECIVLKENYRSTATILKLADELLKSSMTKEVLHSNTPGDNKILLNQYQYQRDEIIGAGMYFKKQIAEGVAPEECAILVPKNYHVRNAIAILEGMNIPVSSGKNMSLFSVAETEMLRRVLGILVNPYNSLLLAESLLDQFSGISAIEAHSFLNKTKPYALTLEELSTPKNGENLFSESNAIVKWGKTLTHLVNEVSGQKITTIVATVGNSLLIDSSSNHGELLSRIEVVRSFINLATLYEEKHAHAKLDDFLKYLDRLESYGTHIELAKFGSNDGVQVMTLHRSKGLEYNTVWIAHMNEETLMSEKKNGFTLPERINQHMEARTTENAKKELYVAITRAKKQCVISYAENRYNGNILELAEIIRDLDESNFIKQNAEKTQKELLLTPEVYTTASIVKESATIADIKKLVQENYSNTKVSVTMLNNYFECSWKWYFRNFLRLPEIKGVSLALGSAVHSTIEFILKEKNLPAEKEIKEKISTELAKEGVESGKAADKLALDAYTAVSTWVENYYKNLAKDFTSERSLQFRDSDFPNLLMYGKVDLTERFPDGSIVITDFKTGSPKTKGSIEKEDDDGRLSGYMRQLAMYSYLIAGAEKGAQVNTSRLLFLEADKNDKNALYSTYITEEQIDLLKRDIKDYDNGLKNGSWVDNVCNYKTWGSSADECPYCKIAKKLSA